MVHIPSVVIDVLVDAILTGRDFRGQVGHFVLEIADAGGEVLELAGRVLDQAVVLVRLVVERLLHASQREVVVIHALNPRHAPPQTADDGTNAQDFDADLDRGRIRVGA